MCSSLGKNMRCLFILSVALTLMAGATLLWWDAADGTRFSRAISDLRDLSADALRDHPVIDPWGNFYEAVEVVATNRSHTFVFSRGPDGNSESLGNDADDIAPWTDRFTWLAAVHPTRQVAILLAVGIAGIVSSVSFLIGWRRSSNKRSPTSRVVTTPTSRSVSMISRNYNPNPVINVRRRW